MAVEIRPRAGQEFGYDAAVDNEVVHLFSFYTLRLSVSLFGVHYHHCSPPTPLPPPPPPWPWFARWLQFRHGTVDHSDRTFSNLPLQTIGRATVPIDSARR